jgi:hypothetical protein
LADLEERRNALRSSVSSKEIKSISQIDDHAERAFALTPAKCQRYIKYRDDFLRQANNTSSQINAILLLESNSSMSKFKTSLEGTVLTEGSF